MSNYTEIRWKQRFQNFDKAYQRLSRALTRYEEDIHDELIVEGFIKTYEFTIELAWKTLKDYLEEEGYLEAKSPKSTIRLALKESFIQGVKWIEAIEDRNLTTHTYDETIAQEVARNIQQHYFLLLQNFYLDFKKRYDE